MQQLPEDIIKRFDGKIIAIQGYAQSKEREREREREREKNVCLYPVVFCSVYWLLCVVWCGVIAVAD